MGNALLRTTFWTHERSFDFDGCGSCLGEKNANKYSNCKLALESTSKIVRVELHLRPEFPSQSIPEDPCVLIRVLVYMVPFTGIASHNLLRSLSGWVHAHTPTRARTPSPELRVGLPDRRQLPSPGLATNPSWKENFTSPR